jgi:hypothetical protein
MHLSWWGVKGFVQEDSLNLLANPKRLALAKLGLRNLDRDDALKPRVASLVHLAHASGTDGCENFVWTEFVAWRERHLDELAKFNPSRRK